MDEFEATLRDLRREVDYARDHSPAEQSRHAAMVIVRAAIRRVLLEVDGTMDLDDQALAIIDALLEEKVVLNANYLLGIRIVELMQAGKLQTMEDGHDA